MPRIDGIVANFNKFRIDPMLSSIKYVPSRAIGLLIDFFNIPC